jgi:transposase
MVILQTEELFNQLLNLGNHWQVTSIEHDQIDLENIIINIQYIKSKIPHPTSNELLNIYDHAPIRQWRHLDIMQYKTYLRARLPRVKGEDGKVVTITPPWADKSVQYSTLFECYIINLLKAAQNQTKTAHLARCGFDVVNRIMHNATTRGLARRKTNNITHLSLDEKSFKKGHNYISVLSNPQTGFILDVEEDRTVKATKKLFNKVLSTKQQKQIETISVDMWQSYLSTAEKLLPNSEIAHDRFHLVKYLNNAIDKVRRKEAKTQGALLKHSRYVLLKNPDNLTEKQQLKFASIAQANLEVSKAWHVRENFKSMFNPTQTPEDALFLFDAWQAASLKLKIGAISNVVDMFCRHLKGVVYALANKFSNAMAERLNGKIQILKSIGRGYRTFDNFRSAILFFYGGLDVYPLKKR